MTKYLVTAKVEHKGYEVNYNERMDQWEVAIKDRTLYDPKLSEIKKKIDRITAPPKPDRLSVLVYRGGMPRQGTITSWDGLSARVTTLNERGKAEREEIYRHSLYDDTKENVSVFAEMAPLRSGGR